MRANCACCRHRQATSEGGTLPLCAICREEGELFFAAYSRGESIETHAESWAVGLIALGMTIACVLTLRWLVQGGHPPYWWPL
jgi:hypothetical protein